MLGLIRPILFRRRRSEKVDFDDGGGEVIGAVLKAREVRGNSTESLTGAGQHVDDQMSLIPVLCVDRLKIYTVICLML